MDTKNLYLKTTGEIRKYQKRYDNREEKIVKAKIRVPKAKHTLKGRTYRGREINYG